MSLTRGQLQKPTQYSDKSGNLQGKPQIHDRPSRGMDKNGPAVARTSNIHKPPNPRGAKHENNYKQPLTLSRTCASRPGASHPIESSIVKDSAFTVIAPDQRKREQILKQAKKEEDAYEAHKRSLRTTHIKMAPQCVGSKGDFSHIEDTRSRQQRELSNFGPGKAAKKTRDFKAKFREEEDRNFEAKKSEASRRSESIAETKGKETRADADQLLREKRLQYLGL